MELAKKDWFFETGVYDFAYGLQEPWPRYIKKIGPFETKETADKEMKKYMKKMDKEYDFVRGPYTQPA